MFQSAENKMTSLICSL